MKLIIIQHIGIFLFVYIVVDLLKNNLVATVKIVCEIISVKYKDENIIEGNPDKIKTVTDYWKFTKDASSANPNWFLAEIISK